MLRHPEASFLLSAGRRQKRKELHRMRHGAIEGRAHGRSGGGGGEIWLKIKSREGKGWGEAGEERLWALGRCGVQGKEKCLA